MRKYNIDFLRIVFLVAILLQHASIDAFSGQNFALRFVANNSLAVEFFFVLAGYFLYNEIEYKKQPLTKFIVKKWIRLAPVCIFATFIHFIFYRLNIVKQPVFWRNEFLNIFFIREIGINSFYSVPLVNNLFSCNTHLWYLGPLFWGSIFHYSIFLYFDKEKSRLLLSVISFVAFVFYSHNFFPVFHGLFRGLSCIGIGYFAHLLGHQIPKNINYNYNYVWGGVEIFCFIEIFTTLLIKRDIEELNFYFILLFCILLISFDTNRGFLGKVLNIKYFGGFMGKYSYSIYVIQYPIQILINRSNKIGSALVSFRDNHPFQELILSLSFIFLVGISAYYLVEKKVGRYLEKIQLLT